MLHVSQRTEEGMRLYKTARVFDFERNVKACEAEDQAWMIVSPL